MHSILVVEDNHAISYNLKVLLEMNGFKVVLAEHGKEAWQWLQDRAHRPPDLILSDIMMPEMDGYALYKSASHDPVLSSVPFVFLTAKTAPEDIRFGKLLGVDDYITKPFNQEDLLATLHGKIHRYNQNRLFRERVEREMQCAPPPDSAGAPDPGPDPGTTSTTTENTDDATGGTPARGTEHGDPARAPRPGGTGRAKVSGSGLTFVFLVGWDDYAGPTLFNVHPAVERRQLPFDLEEVATRLYHISAGLYGNNGFAGAQGILTRLGTLEMDGYVYFDVEPDASKRGGEHLFMVGVVSPRIAYLEAQRIEEILQERARQFHASPEIDLEACWEEIVTFL